MLLLATMLTFTACSSDDDEKQPDYPSIIGTWTRTAVETSSGNTSITIEQTQIFRADNTATGKVYMYLNNNLMQQKTFEYTYTYNGSVLKMTSKDDGTSQTFSVSISNNTLTMTGDDGTLTFTRK